MRGPSRSSAGGVQRFGTFHAFRNPSFRLLWPANFASYTSRWMQMTLLAWLVLDLTDSPWRVSLVGFFSMAPLLALGLVGGILADRIDRRRMLLATQTANLAAALGMAALLLAGREAYWHAYVVMSVIGMGWALDNPARRSLILDLVGRSAVTNAVALDSTGMHSSRLVGPLAAGVLIATVEVRGAYVIVTLLSVVSLVLLRLLGSTGRARSVARSRRRRLQASDQTSGLAGMTGNLLAGFRYVRTSRVALGVILITVLMNLLLFPYMNMVPVVARDELGVGPELMGVLMASDGLGALMGGVMVASFRRLTRHGIVFMGGALLAMTALLGFSFSQSYGLSLPVLLVLGVGIAGFSTMQSTIVMLTAPEEMRGRALGVVTLAIGAGPIGSLIVGGVASARGAPFALGIHAVIGLISVGLVSLMMPALRRRILPAPRAAAAPRGAPMESAEPSDRGPGDDSGRRRPRRSPRPARKGT